MTDEQEQEITAEELGYFAQSQDKAGYRAVAIVYRRAARTIERLEREVTALHAGMREQEPHAEVGRLIGRVVEMSQRTPYLIYYDAEGSMRRVALDAPDLRQLVAALEAARQPEPVRAPSGAVYEVRGGKLFVYVEAVPASFWTQSPRRTSITSTR